jgi:hypothetical protein
MERVFSVLAFFVRCIGIFGVSSFVAEQRSKETGVRKVLGAFVVGEWELLSLEFFVLVLFSLALHC